MNIYRKSDIPEHLQKFFTPAEIGLEQTPEQYVANMVFVFEEVRRVLRDDGTLWLNIGDSFASDTKGSGGPSAKQDSNAGSRYSSIRLQHGLKPKDLVGIPWRVAFALQQPRYNGRILDERDRIWLAAMIDGEGCIFIHKRKAGQSNGQGYNRKHDNFASGLEVANTNRAIVERCLQIAGLGSICTQEGGRFGRKQTLFRWNLRSNQCRDLIAEVYPHLVAKQHEARLAIGCPSSGADAERAHESLKAIHNGGEPSIDFPPPESLFGPGWYLRSDIIWKKPNPMPESVTDRPTKAHEYIFLLSKSARYYYDADAIREDFSPASLNTERKTSGAAKRAALGDMARTTPVGRTCGVHANGRNKRDVWTVNSKPYPGSHFACFPPKLIEPCILAGCPLGGVVLDPFFGSGTTGQVAEDNGRKWIGFDINADYAKLQKARTAQMGLLGTIQPEG